MHPKPFALKTRLAASAVALLVLFGLPISAVLTGKLAIPAVQMNVTAFQPNIFGIISLCIALVNLGLLLYFVSKPARTSERLWLTVYLFAAVIYPLVTALQQMTTNAGGALFWGNMCSVAVMVSPSIFLFALYYTNQSDRQFPGLTGLLIAGIFMLLFVENFTTLVFVNSVKYAVLTPWGWDYRGALGPQVWILTLWYYVLLACAIILLIQFRRHTRNPLLRKQSLLFVIAVCFPLGLGVVFDVVLPILGVDSIPPLTPLLSMPTAALFIYGIVRYQLLTVNPTIFSNTILGIMKEAVVATDSEFNIIYENPTALQILNIDSGSKQKLSLIKKLDVNSVARFRQSFDTAQDVVNIGQLDLVPSGNKQIPVRLTGSRMQLGRDTVWILVLADITNELQTRKVIEHEVTVRTRELNEARTYLVSSINSLEQGFVLVNAKAEIELVNHKASELFHLNPEAARGQSVATTLQADGWGVNLATTVGHALETKRSRQVSVAATDGTFYEVYLTPVLSGTDHALGATVVIQDVTEAKILDRSKDEFFSIASHELRTPLTAIRGNMSMLKDYFPQVLKEASVHDLVDDTHAASVRLIEIVNDFLDSSRLEQGKMAFSFGPVKLAPLIDSVRDDLKVIRETQGNTAVTKDLDKLPPVWADEGRLRQILYNLFSNANKYSDHATITVSGSVDDGKVTILVIDTGKGISPENQKLLFHKFQQAGESILTRDNTKGTGLGLYIARLLAKAMKGDVVLEHSEEGKGSTFSLTVPVATKEQLKQQPAPVSTDPLATAAS